MPNDNYANEPNQSRSEDIIQSILDNTEYNEEARSRIEYLLIELKNAIEGGGGGGGVTSYAPLTEKPKIDNHTLQAGNNTSSDLGLQTKLTFDSAPTENSTNPVTSDGVYTALDSKANSSDVYNKSAVDAALTAKADKSTTYTKSEVDTSLSSKQNTISDLSTIRSGAALGATAVQPVSGKALSTNDYTTAEKTKLAGIAEGAEVNEIDGIKVNNTTINPDVNKVVNITVPTTATDVSALPDTTKYAAALSLTINSSTYVMTGQLKDQNGDNLGTAQTIDLPLESVVVGGSYNSQTKKVVLTLQNGNTDEFSVADLVSGLQTELSASNKLNPAYINYDSTHAAVTEAQRDQITTNKTDISTVIMKKVPIASGDLNNVTDNSYAVYTDVVSNKPTAETSYIVKTSVYDNNIILQEATALNANAATYTRIKRSGNWQAWKLSNLNDTQLAAVNSGIDSTKVAQIETNQNNILWNTQNGVKNLFNLTKVSKTYSNVVFTINSDKTVTVSGTASPYDSVFHLDDWTCTKAGTYVVSGTPSDGSWAPSPKTYRIRVAVNGTWKGDEVGNGFELTLAVGDVINLQINTSTIYTANNLVFKPMITLKSLYDADPTYQSYAMSNAELTAAIQALQAQINQ